MSTALHAALVALLLVATVRADVCPPGTSGPGGAAPCTPCAPGTWTDQLGSTTCFPCPFGTIAPASGSPTCTPCDAGTYAPDGDGIECLPCAPGSFAPNVGFDYCLSCYDDEYQPASGATACLECAAGQHAFLPYPTRCFTCDALVDTVRLVTDAPLPSTRHLKLSADLVLPPPGLAAFDPATDDVIISALPGLRASLQAEPALWRASARRTKWTYTNPYTHLSATLTDRSRKTPGRVHLRLLGNDLFPYVAPGGLPVEIIVAVRRGDVACAGSGPLGDACRFRAGTDALRCLAHGPSH